MSLVALVIGLVLGVLGFGGGGYFAYKKYLKKKPENIMLELAGEIGFVYDSGGEGRPPFTSGTYSGRGVTLDLLNEKGYMDIWHPHSRVVVSVNRNIRDTHIVAKRGRFYSRKLGEVDVDHPRFNDDFIFLSSSPKKADKLITREVAQWIINLDMPFVLSDGHIVYHQEKHFEDKKRIKHIIDALVYIANLAEKR